jgi:hypothetical protein
MERPSPAQVLKEFDDGASYGKLVEKYGISNHTARKLVAMGREERGDEVESFDGFDSEEQTYRIVQPAPFHPVCGEGPFNVGEVISIRSFPRRKYAEWRLRNLVAEGRAVKI